MVFSASMRRMVTGRAKGRRRAADEAARRQKSYHRLSATGSSVRATANSLDVEAHQTLRRRFAREPEHGAWNFWGGSNEVDNELVETNEDGQEPEEVQTFEAFYKGKVLKMQAKEGGLSHIPISGNLYMYKSLAPFADATGLFQKKTTCFVEFGLYVIMVLQIFAPLGMLVPALVNIDYGGHGSFMGMFGVHQFAEYKLGDQEYGVSHFFQRWLGLIFLVLFLMNGLYVLENDRIETQKLTELIFLFRAVRHDVKDDEGNLPPRPSTRWLWIGAVMNSACLILCGWAMVFVFIIEEGPKDLILDAFGLAFLYNLDDIGGDLAFLDEKWDEDFMGDLYGELDELYGEKGEASRAVEASRSPLEASSPLEDGDVSPDVELGGETSRPLMDDDAPRATKSSAGIFREQQKRRAQSFTPDAIFWFTNVVVTVMLIVCPFIYVFVEMKPKDVD